MKPTITLFLNVAVVGVLSCKAHTSSLVLEEPSDTKSKESGDIVEPDLDIAERESRVAVKNYANHHRAVEAAEENDAIYFAVKSAIAENICDTLTLQNVEIRKFSAKKLQDDDLSGHVSIFAKLIGCNLTFNVTFNAYQQEGRLYNFRLKSVLAPQVANEQRSQVWTNANFDLPDLRSVNVKAHRFDALDPAKFPAGKVDDFMPQDGALLSLPHEGQSRWKNFIAEASSRFSLVKAVKAKLNNPRCQPVALRSYKKSPKGDTIAVGELICSLPVKSDGTATRVEKLANDSMMKANFSILLTLRIVSKEADSSMVDVVYLTSATVHPHSIVE